MAFFEALAPFKILANLVLPGCPSPSWARRTSCSVEKGRSLGR